MLKEWLAVAVGGMIGTLVRHAIGLWTRGWGGQYVPLATLGVNVMGCLLIGMLFQWTANRQLQGSWWEVAIRVGFLGGLTTFSSFGLDVQLAWQSRPLWAFSLILAHVALGLISVALGMRLMSP